MQKSDRLYQISTLRPSLTYAKKTGKDKILLNVRNDSGEPYLHKMYNIVRLFLMLNILIPPKFLQVATAQHIMFTLSFIKVMIN